MGIEHEEPHGSGIDTLFGEVLRRQNIAESLGHLGATHGQELAVQPVAGERLARRSLGLRDLVLMVREDQIDPTRVDVQGLDAESLAQLGERHDRAFEMPPRPTAPERRIPGRADIFVDRHRCLPQGKIPRILFVVFVRVDTRAGLQFAPFDL